MKKNNMILKIVDIVLFAGGIVFCIAAICGHKPAYPVAACCFFAAIAVMSAMNKDKGEK
ncbi:hypothetical protein [uncultured Dysosmobacter sp.]|uniref:hypothetical protein n=1 Tax=uncultured Dysosmobacter sp. TaxID=2591384 RepID=UPI0026045F02|nr:hypothetical protein [uncultured Dysosmobacter sp.]